MERVKIGWAKKEVSTTEKVALAGQMHFRLSKGIHDPLYVTALAIDGGAGQDAVILVSCDVIVLSGGIINQVIGLVAERDPSIPGDAIVMNATHTHTGSFLGHTRTETPEGEPIYPWDKYRDFFAAQAADAICEAWANRKPGGVGYGYSYAVVGHSRRTVYFVDKSLKNPSSSDGYCVMYGITRDPDFSHYEAGADHFVNVLITYDEKKKITGFVVNVACPSQVSGSEEQMSADYWNEVREAIAKEFGEDVFVLPQCAAAGDLAPRLLHYTYAQARRMGLKYDLPYEPKLAKACTTDGIHKQTGERLDIAERILFAVKDVASWAGKDIQTEVKVEHVLETVPLKLRLITEEEKAHCERMLETLKPEIPEGADEREKQFRLSRYQTYVRRNKTVLERYQEQRQNPDQRLPMRMHVLRIGDVAMATNRFELYQDFQHRIQARSPFIQTFVIQLAGDEFGSYLPTERAVKNRGYGSSFYENKVGPEGGQQLVEETLRILNDLKAKDET